MADQETLLNLADDEVAVVAFLSGHDGHLAQDTGDPAVYWLTVRPCSVPPEIYYVRLAWTAYPHSPPSIKFADSPGGTLTVTRAWPLIPGYRATSFDICKPLSAEGYGLHPEWQRGPDAWPTTGNPFLWVVEMIQFDLDNSYTGRAS